MTDPLAAIIEALAERVADVVCLRLGATRATEYGSRPPDAAPPGRSHRWLRDHARQIPGAQRLGGARGRSVV